MDPGDDDPVPGTTACWITMLGPVGTRVLVKRNRIVILSATLGRSGAAAVVGINQDEASILEEMERQLQELSG